jgi:glycosyltransferase involved in cell wall biosynthesis
MARIAWFTPLPPIRSGIAAYSAELLPLLAGRFEIDVIVDMPPGAGSSETFDAPRGTRLLSAHDFVWHRRERPYDLTVFQLGNAACHDYMWPYLFHYPGLVVLHDGQLHHARASRLLLLKRFQHYRDELAYNHPETASELAEFAISGLEGASYYLWPMLRAVAETGRVLAVHNRWLASEIRQLVPEAVVELVEMGVADPLPLRRLGGAGIRERYRIPRDALIFAAYGMVTPEKRIELVLDAFRAVSRSVDARLLLVGDVPSHFDPFAAAEAREVADRIVITGYVADEELPDFLDAADVCVCLRWPSARETSASWLRCLAAGKPTIITDLIHTADVPALDPRTWRLNHAPSRDGGTAEPIAVSIDVLDEDHSVRLAMQRLATDRQLRATLGRRAREFWQRAHTLEQMRERYLEVLAKALESPPAEASAAGRGPAHLTDTGATRLDALVRDLHVSVDW